MTLDYLLFDTSEGSDGTGLFEAMAAVAPAHAAAVEAEIAQVLAWAEAQFPGGRAPVEDGGDWDAELQVTDEADGGIARRVYTLSIGGSEAFCAAFAGRFGDALA
ncbi:hypothetical protein [Pseudorhodoferax sp. Leaf267]|uniref:hypothetical protein n=1 Tax=Pseudorhodoferax sp. Leaf267 TaxID=1736316 RepID=UPI0006F57660|nr:hypothetical protein [Pseudorhodoferax sp. Leaf267]KQP21968.1 hypothetical protein ASF43_24250 [Pseudorhodoferax sp. Leaf267]